MRRPLALVPESVGPHARGAADASTGSSGRRAPRGVRVDVSDIDRDGAGLLDDASRAARGGGAGAAPGRPRSHAQPGTPLPVGYSVRLGADELRRSGGILKKIRPETDLRASLEQAAPADRLRLLASHGLWYDALDLLSRSIAAQPGDARLREARAQLFDQAGPRRCRSLGQIRPARRKPGGSSGDDRITGLPSPGLSDSGPGTDCSYWSDGTRIDRPHLQLPREFGSAFAVHQRV